MKSKLLNSLFATAVLAFSNFVSAGVIGYYTGDAVNAVNQATTTMLNKTGYSYTGITSVANFNLNTIDVLFTARYDSPLLTQRATDIKNWVLNGGVLLIDDASRLNGYFFNQFNAVRTGISSANVQVANTAASTLVNGRFGQINNTTLDNGSSSVHGGVALNSLPANAIVHLTGLDGNQVAAFSFKMGLGNVYYSTIPGYCYLGSCSSIQPFTSNYQNIYLPNLMDYGMSLSNQNRNVNPTVPEPSSLMMFILGACVLLMRRFK